MCINCVYAIRTKKTDKNCKILFIESVNIMLEKTSFSLAYGSKEVVCT